MNHEHYMQLAIKQALQAQEEGEVPAGCVIVRTVSRIDLGETGSAPSEPVIVGQAHNQVELLKDPTAHAEMIAITQAANAVGDWRLTNTVLYVTKEPCAMCAGAIILARIPTVVFGTHDPLRGGAVSTFNILNNPQLNHRCEIIPDVLKEECRALLQNFFQKQR